MITSRPETDLRAAWASVSGIVVSVLLFHRVNINLGVSDFVLALAVLAGIRQGEWRRWWDLRRDPLARWSLGFFASVVIGLIVGRLRLGHLTWWALVNRGLGLLLLIGIFFVFASAARHRVWFYLRSFVVAGSLLNLAGLVAVLLRYACDYGSVFFFGHTSLRLTGLMHNPNAYGGYLVALLSIQLVALAFGKSVFGRPWLDSVNAGALLVASVFTISRGSWLAALVSALAVPIVARAARREIPRGWGLAAPAMVVLCLAGILLVARTGALWPALRMDPRPKALQDSSSIYFPRGGPSLSEFIRVASDPSGEEARMSIMRTALGLYATSPSTSILGLGVGTFAEMAPTTDLRTSVTIHNSFLWALVELGPLGAVCLLGIFLATLRTLWSSLRVAAESSEVPAALFVAIVGLMAWCMSSDGTYLRHLWYLLGLAAATAAAGRDLPAPQKSAAKPVL